MDYDAKSLDWFMRNNSNYSYVPYKVDSVSLLYTNPYLTYFIIVLYCLIFVVGLFGNTLVLYVVIRHKAMRTITNKFIACLSVSDLLICLFSIPFTPLNSLMKHWVFGELLCRLVPIILVVTVFVSTLTSVVIAIDRYMVIVHPYTPRMSSEMQIIIIVAIWVMASSTALPIGIYTDLTGNSCAERWPNRQSSMIYSYFILILQLVLPSMVIAGCYAMVSYQLRKRNKLRLGQRDYQKEKLEASKNSKINRMLISMIVIFIICWLPLNAFHLHTMADSSTNAKNAVTIAFLFCHIIAMSSVMYNPFLYGWMNENFQRHFKEIFRPITYKLVCSRSSENCDTIVEDGNGSRYTRSTLAVNRHPLTAVNNNNCVEHSRFPLLSQPGEKNSCTTYN